MKSYSTTYVEYAAGQEGIISINAKSKNTCNSTLQLKDTQYLRNILLLVIATISFNIKKQEFTLFDSSGLFANNTAHRTINSFVSLSFGSIRKRIATSTCANKNLPIGLVNEIYYL